MVEDPFSNGEVPLNDEYFRRIDQYWEDREKQREDEERQKELAIEKAKNEGKLVDLKNFKK
jgi:hypothetical protein